MRIGSCAVAFREPRFIVPHLDHLKVVDEKLVLNSLSPWQGTGEDNETEPAIGDRADILRYDWPTEHDQRNAGQEYFSDMDWVLTLDPDEFLTIEDQHKLKEFLENAPSNVNAFVCERQFTYWKRGYRIDPLEDYKQIIAVRPGVRFVDKRVVNQAFGMAPVTLHHFSWARTDAEILNKITHYAHAHEINPNWYEDVWLADKRENVHPLTPTALRRVVPVELPKELEDLNIWAPR